MSKIIVDLEKLAAKLGVSIQELQFELIKISMSSVKNEYKPESLGFPYH